tara:strand:- start:35 stop:226 length:192 start_codon:yes stop_codon:yes gene_type:complete
MVVEVVVELLYQELEVQEALEVVVMVVNTHLDYVVHLVQQILEAGVEVDHTLPFLVIVVVQVL